VLSQFIQTIQHIYTMSNPVLEHFWDSLKGFEQIIMDVENPTDQMVLLVTLEHFAAKGIAILKANALVEESHTSDHASSTTLQSNTTRTSTKRRRSSTTSSNHNTQLNPYKKTKPSSEVEITSPPASVQHHRTNPALAPTAGFLPTSTEPLLEISKSQLPLLYQR
jgi:hypothetical protein